MRRFLATYRNAYLREHPFAYCFAVGAFLVGVVYCWQVLSGDVLNPVLTSQPQWAQIVWALDYLVGGALAARGIRLSRPRLETPGFALLASALFIAAIIQASQLANYVALISGCSLGIGCALRSWLRARYSAGIDDAI